MTCSMCSNSADFVDLSTILVSAKQDSAIDYHIRATLTHSAFLVQNAYFILKFLPLITILLRALMSMYSIPICVL